MELKMKVYRFSATWCQPCQHLARQLELLGVVLPAIDVDTREARPLLDRFGVRSVPTIVLEYEGGAFDKFTGASISEELKTALKTLNLLVV
jgi:thioredoxin 1